MPETLGVPLDGEGLAWIVAQGFLQLNLLPGIRLDTILAASLGNQQAVALLRAIAQQHVDASSANPMAFEPLHSFPVCDCRCCEASHEVRVKREHTLELHMEAARQGRLAAMHWLRVLCEPSLDGSEAISLKLAAACGHLDMIKLLLSGPGPAPWDDEALIAAAAQPKCFAWLLQQGPERWKDQWHRVLHGALRGLADNGHLDAMSYIHDHVWPIPEDYLAWLSIVAAGCGNLSMVQWLRSLESPTKEWPKGLCTVAARSGNLTLLQWLRNQDPPCPWLNPASCTAAAAESGNLATLQWLCAQDPPCELSPLCTTHAARAGRMDLLEWLRARRPPCPWYVSEQFDAPWSCTWIAADRQDLAMLQWLRAQNCPWDAACSLRAVEKGNIPMLQWLLAQVPPSPLNPDSMAAAALEGHLPMMQYLHGMGCALDASLYYLVAEANTADALRWLLKQGVPAPTCYLTEKDYGFRHEGQKIRGHMLMFLADIGAPLPAFLAEKAFKYETNLQVARSMYCTFHGLLRWSRQAVADPRLDIERAFNRPSSSMAGEHLLIRLSMLPQELISKIATMAELQHGVELL